VAKLAERDSAAFEFDEKTSKMKIGKFLAPILILTLVLIPSSQSFGLLSKLKYCKFFIY